MATLADLLRAGYVPPTESALADPIKEHIRSIPQKFEENQRAQMDLLARAYPGNTFKSNMLEGDPKAMAELAMQAPIMGIVSPKVVNQFGMATTLPKNDIFSQAVANTPNARITDEGLYMNLMRKQKPEQAMTESVRSGVFYLPEGSANIKHYGGSNSYGGTEKIAGETLYKNPLFVKGSTGGKAPEMAYAQLTDKNQLKILQDDVFKAVNSGSSNMRDDLIQQFLEKHAPDLTDYASYIADNSRKGNQLRYALQEAAVAQKVRDAGYDAVIGHSKGKQGPFISEVFDIRESHYPDKYGNFNLNPKFEEMTRKQILEQELKKRVE
jgi:hypothetical protein